MTPPVSKLRHNWDKKLRIATGTIKRRNTNLLPWSAAVDVSEPREDCSLGIRQEDGGVQYHGFVYYPRQDSDGQPVPDPPVTASPLHRVQCIQLMRGQPYWVREALTKLGLEDKLSSSTVVINSAENNALLYIVKHVVRIDPVTFPDGIPLPDDDLNSWRLLEDGRVVRYTPPSNLKSEYQDKYAVGGDTLKKRMLLRWNKPFNLNDKATC